MSSLYCKGSRSKRDAAYPRRSPVTEVIGLLLLFLTIFERKIYQQPIERLPGLAGNQGPISNEFKIFLNLKPV